MGNSSSQPKLTYSETINGFEDVNNFRDGFYQNKLVKKLYVQGYPHFSYGVTFTGWILNRKCFGYCRFVCETSNNEREDFITFVYSGVPIGKQINRSIFRIPSGTGVVERFSDAGKNVSFRETDASHFLRGNMKQEEGYFIINYIPRYFDAVALEIQEKSGGCRNIIETSDDKKTTTLTSREGNVKKNVFLIPFIPSVELLNGFDEADYAYLKNPSILGRLVEIPKEQQRARPNERT